MSFSAGHRPVKRNLEKPSLLDYDYIIIGSGFGGSVSALRLSEKGYKVLMLEKGKWLKANDFPKTNWHLKKWLWLPALKFFGLFKITVFRHVAILSGVGVGGGSLVYANTLPVPKAKFFKAESWAHLADWENELKDFYSMALQMMGAAMNPRLETGDRALQQLAQEIGKADHCNATQVAVYFGEPGVAHPDPYFATTPKTRWTKTICILPNKTASKYRLNPKSMMSLRSRSRTVLRGFKSNGNPQHHSSKRKASLPVVESYLPEACWAQ